MTIHEHLQEIKACLEAQSWASDKSTGQECWDKTDRIDWLFWWSAQTGQVKQVAECARIIANSVKHLQNANAAYAYANANAAEAYAYANANADAAAAAANADAYAAAAANAEAYAYANANADAAAANANAEAYKKQKALNLKIARENLTCPFPG